MSNIDYKAEAELFPSRRRSLKGGLVGYKRFQVRRRSHPLRRRGTPA